MSQIPQNKDKLITKICETCGERYQTWPYNIKRRYCSWDCRKTSKLLHCTQCSKEFKRQPAQLKRRGLSWGVFCSPNCLHKYRFGMIPWNKGLILSNSYGAIHEWVRKNKSKPMLCEVCNVKVPCDISNISGEYKRDLNDYRWLCRGCHMGYDYSMGIRIPRGV
jgi:hypothetical protein